MDLSEKILEVIFKWQELAGAFLGVIIPIVFYLVKESYDKSLKAKEDKVLKDKKHRDYLVLLEKNIILAINNLAEIDLMFNRFFTGNFKEMKETIIEDTGREIRTIGGTFIPLSSAFVFDKSILTESSESNFIENKILEVISNSHEIPIILEDINRQFTKGLEINTELGLRKLNTVEAHNRMFLANMNHFEDMFKEQLTGHNIPVYLRKLVSARVPVQYMLKIGLEEWSRKFSHFSQLPAEEKYNQMEEFFKDDTNEMIKSFYVGGKKLHSDMLLVGQKSKLEVL